MTACATCGSTNTRLVVATAALYRSDLGKRPRICAPDGVTPKAQQDSVRQCLSRREQRERGAK